MARKACPQCAERVRSEARVCRYCGHIFSQNPVIETARVRITTGMAAAALGVIALGGTGWLTYSVWSDLERTRANSVRPSDYISPSAVEDPTQQQPEYEQISLGATFEWVAESSPDEVQRQGGPYVIRVTKQKDGELVAPVVKVTSGSSSVTMVGSLASAGFTNNISLIENRRGAVPVVMLQSFSGGAHCCNHIQLAGFSEGRLKVVDLGGWDGDLIEIPKDESGDGLLDFVMYDNRFLYSFASYADSYAPPRILNVAGGEVEDVSRNPKFRRLFEEEMARAGERCQPGGNNAPNGACAALVASAARVGKLDQAWGRMLAAYDASSGWEMPTGCLVSDEGGCPSGREIVYKSYPESLHAFLVEIGYIPKSWVPPELRRSKVKEPTSSPPPDNYTA
jgi:hypothetical protein